jgi:hypothetical protein
MKQAHEAVVDWTGEIEVLGRDLKASRKAPGAD